MKEYVNEMLIESARKNGHLCASDIPFNATTINNYMALFANKGGISLTEKSIARLMPVGQQNIHPLGQWLLSSLWPVHISMGAWIAPTHRSWIWYYNSSTDDLHRIEKGKVHHYLRTANNRRTRSSTPYDLAWEEDLIPTFKRGALTSVITYTNTKVNKLNKGVPFAKGLLLPTNFWEFLDTWGETWMWESIDDSQQYKHNLSWIVEGMKSNTLTWVTDGLYDRKRAADLCGVGWIIFCSKTGLRLTGTFWERSPSASSYHAEMLGLCGLLHVYGHMDKYLLWHQLSLIQQLNCVCNTLAKQAVTLGMYPPSARLFRMFGT